MRVWYGVSQLRNGWTSVACKSAQNVLRNRKHNLNLSIKCGGEADTSLGRWWRLESRRA
jgi:hypothetical protein